MMTKDKIKGIIKECKESGEDVTTRDVAYVVLCNFLDEEVAYRCLFTDGKCINTKRYNAYKESSRASLLRQLVGVAMGKQSEARDSGDITFEENKAYMLQLKRQTEEAIASNEIDKKDGLKILADLSVKLNDKFQVREERVEQVVHVFNKFNAICQCGREIYIPTKEDMMEKYNLIEKE